MTLTEERDVFDAACTNIRSTLMALKNWGDQEPRVHHLCDPVLVWFTHTISNIESSPADEIQNGKARVDTVIGRLLVIVQGILSSDIPLEPSEATQPPDNYASDSENISCDISRLLAVESVARTVALFMDELTILPPSRRLEMIQSMLPFVDAYLRLVYNHLLVQTNFVKSLLKLSYVLCSVVLSLSTKGFCKPPDVEESTSHGEGTDGAEVQDGTGLGQGTGSQNVSDQIEDQSQVEGIRGEETKQEQPGNDATDGDGIEMDDDFEGEMGDRGSNENEESGDDGNQPEAEEQVGQVDATDPDAVDEKIWGDENIVGEVAEGQASKDVSKEKNVESEVVAKENQENHRTDERDEMNDNVQESAGVESDDRDEMPEEHPIDAGKKMDDFVPEANTLDLPDDLDLGAGEDGQGENPDIGDDPMDEDGLEEHFGDTADHELVPEDAAEVPGSPLPDESHAGNEDNVEGESHEPKPTEEQLPEPVARPDLSTGDGRVGDMGLQSTSNSPSEGRFQNHEDDVRGNGSPSISIEISEVHHQGNKSVSFLFFSR